MATTEQLTREEYIVLEARFDDFARPKPNLTPNPLSRFESAADAMADSMRRLRDLFESTADDLDRMTLRYLRGLGGKDNRRHKKQARRRIRARQGVATIQAQASYRKAGH
jgi:hypothetical protein